MSNPAPKMYGIKHCDKVRVARVYLEEKGVAFDMHDYKKEGVDVDALKAAFAMHGWENVINRKSVTWRKLPEADRAAMDEAGAIKAAQDNASIVKRPILIAGDQIILGFDEEAYGTL